jgi:hypothetical protein
MKNNFKSLLTLMIFFSTLANAQLNYKNGYIISLENDTLFGKINDGGGFKNSDFCLYKADKTSKTVKYYPKDIKSYRFIGDKYYSAKEVLIKGEYRFVFVDVLLEGKLNLYYTHKNKELEYYLEKDGKLIGLLNKKVNLPISSESLYGLMNNQTYKPVYSDKYYNQTSTDVYVDVYKDSLFTVFKDSEKVRNQVDSIKYNQKSLIKITKAYINEICTGDDCINFEKDFNLKRPRFGIYSGVQLSKITWKTGEKSNLLTTVPVGIFLNVPLSLINDRLSFQVELATSSLKHNQLYSNILDSVIYMEMKYKTLGIPVLLKYEIKGKRVSPSIAIGKEMGFFINSDVAIRYTNTSQDDLVLHETQRGGWFFEAGLDYKLGPKFSLFSNIRVQSYSNLILLSKEQRVAYSDAVENDLYVTEYKTNFATLHIGMKF